MKAVQRISASASATTTNSTRTADLFPDSEDVTRRVLEAGLVGVVDDVIVLVSVLHARVSNQRQRPQIEL